jgi:hypothetical protein
MKHIIENLRNLYGKNTNIIHYELLNETDWVAVIDKHPLQLLKYDKEEFRKLEDALAPFGSEFFCFSRYDEKKKEEDLIEIVLAITAAGKKIWTNFYFTQHDDNKWRLYHSKFSENKINWSVYKETVVRIDIDNITNSIMNWFKFESNHRFDLLFERKSVAFDRNLEIYLNTETKFSK